MDEQTLFLEILNLTDPTERAALLDRECAERPDLRARVEGLLQAYERSGEFLDVPALEQMEDNQLIDETRSEPTQGNHEIDLSFLEPTSAPDSLGRLQHYEIREMIGHGGCGVVFRAFDTKLERMVAIKVMLPELAATSPARKRFLREARATAAIRHANVVTIYAVEEKPLPFLVMEFIDGETLKQRINRTGPLEASEVLRIGYNIACGLAAAHQSGLIHRDIKPANILVENGSDQLKITDFGLARSVDDASITQSGVIAGTPLYMSPEQAQAFDIDARSDLFSLGSVLYVLGTGRPPFRASSTLAVMRRVAEDDPRPIQAIIPEFPTWLVTIIAKLHAKDPAHRFANSQALVDLLDDCQTQLKTRGHVELSPNVSPPPKAIPEDSTDIESSSEMVSLPSGSTPSWGWIDRKWQLAALVLVALLISFGTTEAVGITQVSNTVIRLISPDGTLVVEVEDPSIQVTIDGKDIVFNGTGVNEIRLRPGTHQFEASKNGDVFRKELVSISRNGREAVSVRSEATPSTSAASEAVSGTNAKKDRQAFKRDYDRFAAGQWVTRLADEADFHRVVKEMEANGATTEATYQDRGVRCDSTEISFHQNTGTNILIRTKVRILSGSPGQNLGVRISRGGKGYLPYVQGDRTFVGLGQTNGRWVGLKIRPLYNRPADEFELAVATIGSMILMYIDGKLVLGHHVTEEWKGPAHFGLKSHLGVVTFQDVQIMKLDDEFLLPTKKSEYAWFATGNWISPVGEEADFLGCMAAQKELDHQSNAQFTDGTIDCDATKLFFPSQASENFVLRARIKRVKGYHLRLLARNGDQEFALNWNGENFVNRYFGLGRVTGPHWYPAKHGNAPEFLPNDFELALAVVDSSIIAYVNGERFLEIPKPKEAKGNWIAGIGVDKDCRALYRDVEIMQLPADEMLPRPKPDYDAFTTGQWEDLFPDEEAFRKCLEVRKEVDKESKATFDKGVVHLDSTYLYLPNKRAKNFILRTHVKNEGGEMHVNLRLSANKNWYVAYWNSANLAEQYFGIGRGGTDNQWQDLQNGWFPEELPEYVELAIASLDQKVFVYIEGKTFLEINQLENEQVRWFPALGATRARGQFANIQYMALPDDAVVEKSFTRGDPDFLAAHETVLGGGIVRINGDDTEIRTPYFLPKPLFRLTGVEFYNANNWNDDAFTIFDGCRDIETLTISGMPHVSGKALRHFSQNKRFKKLDFNSSGTIGEGLIHLAGCKDLEILYIWGTKLSKDDLLTFAQCPLKDINFGATAIQDEWLTQFTNLDGLQAINIRYTSVGDQGFAALKNCKDLKRLSVDHTKITDQGIAHFHDCTELEVLTLANTKVTDTGLLPFLSCRNLKVLDVTNTRVTPEAIAKYQKALPECKITWDKR